MPKAGELTILIVDDQASMRGICKYLLAQLGFKAIVEAKSGRDAFTKLDGTDVHLIISDWNMADIDGLMLLRAVRQHPRTKALPFIMATGRGDKDQVQLAIAAGVNNYIIKPYDGATLKKRIEAVIGALW